MKPLKLVSTHFFVAALFFQISLTFGQKAQQSWANGQKAQQSWANGQKSKHSWASGGPLNDVSHLLEPLLSEYNAPALGGIVLDTSGVLGIAATGLRKRSVDNVNVTSRDLWHLGSVTKSMTATLVARLVEAGTVSWNDTVGDIFSRLNLRDEFYGINFLHLLGHRSGIPANADWQALSESHPTLKGQRVNTVRALNNTELLFTPGSDISYSNWGYVVAGAMLEEVTGQPWEELMGHWVFGPLGMDSAGYGPTSGSDELTQPWGHDLLGRPWQVDNPLVMGPAGTVHVSLEDWAKFVGDHLRGALGLPALLTPESYTRLHTDPFGGTYALGWVYNTADWAQGLLLWHNGSNNLNYAQMAIDRDAGIAAIASCNQGYKAQVTDEVLRVMVTEGQRLSKKNKGLKSL